MHGPPIGRPAGIYLEDVKLNIMIALTNHELYTKTKIIQNNSSFKASKHQAA
jgi:hypothetical protein